MILSTQRQGLARYPLRCMSAQRTGSEASPCHVPPGWVLLMLVHLFLLGLVIPLWGWPLANRDVAATNLRHTLRAPSVQRLRWQRKADPKDEDMNGDTWMDAVALLEDASASMSPSIPRKGVRASNVRAFPPSMDHVHGGCLPGSIWWSRHSCRLTGNCLSLLCMLVD